MTSNPFDLTGRVAVVTGAGSGIGRASALALANCGASVVCADIEEAATKETAEIIREEKGKAEWVKIDVAQLDQLSELVRLPQEKFGRLDIMCNIAGIMHQSLVVDTLEEDLDRVLAVNLKGVFFGCQEAAKVMMANRSGCIVNMVSSAIDAPAPGIVCYAIAKAGVAQLTRTLAVEMGKYGVRVNAVAPGFVITGMTSRHFRLDDGSMDLERREAVVSAMGKMAPLRRVGEPEDVASAVVYLASDAASFVTGQIIRVNGGVSMP